MFIDRYILYTSIPFYILIAILINYFIDKTKYFIIVILVFITSQLVTLQLNPDNNRRLKTVAQIVSTLKNKNTVTFIAPDYAFMGFSYHYNIEYFKQAPNTVKLLNQDNIFPVNSIDNVNMFISKSDGTKWPYCIYVQAGTEFTDPHNMILKELESKYKMHKNFHVYEIYDIHYLYN